ncbi:MAG: hypothetical protein KF745_11865 [Phycisphaeraceae bacterium]|nr:hypothetical protein [Phycisphaeraceae bacterium]
MPTTQPAHPLRSPRPSPASPLARLGRAAAAALIAAAGLAPLALTPAADAQVAIRIGGGGARGAGGGISRASFERAIKPLGLDQNQAEAANALFDVYSQEIRAASREMRDQMAPLEAGLGKGDLSAINDKIPALVAKNAERTAASEKTLLTDIQSLLTPEQAERWPAFERVRRRDQFLRFSLVSGAAVDLVSLIDSLKLPPDELAAVKGTLDEYELAMDRVLQERERDAKDDAPVMRMDPEKAQAQMTREREQGVKTREVNQRYARLLASQLSDENKAKLDELFKARAFRQIYGRSPVTRKLAAAEKLRDLTPQQRERLAALKDKYQSAARPLNDRWASAQEQAETDGKALGLPFMIRPMGGADDGELATARTARKDLDSRYDTELASILTPDQLNALPADPAFGHNTDVIAFTTDEGDEIVAETTEFEMEDSGGDGVIRVRSVTVGTPGPGEGVFIPAPPPKP